MHYIKTLFLAIFATLFITSTSSAHDYKVGDLVVEHPFARATPPKARVAGGYMTVTNTGTSADRLVGGSAAFAGRVEIHEMAVENDIMRMRPLVDGIEIPAGETVIFKPGSYHVMFMAISEPLKEGSRHTVTLEFEKAGTVDVEIAVEGMNAGAKHDMKNGKKMDHSDHKSH
ncbi:MAG: copper chaperone PCu(A)C [Hyphomicrobiales bacterium]